MTSRRARRGAAILALCLGLGLPSVAGCGGSAHRSAAADEPSKRPAPPVVMFLGDSYTVGERGALPETTYAPATARLLGWQVIVGGRAGTGFVAHSAVGDAYLNLFEGQLGWRPAPDLLIVSGGHNDWRFPPAQVAAAANAVLERARQRWPGTRVVLMGPLWGSAPPPQKAVDIRDALKPLAARLQIPFIDPIAEQWITGNRRNGTGNATLYIRKDGTHPNPAGHRYVAARLAEDIKRLGLAHPVRGQG
ncbi:MULTISPECIES: SGNH/GDSL hydrolase family protein [Actinomadura]|uniref:SGNH/GDSL hydrolase family protein n=1 Tax=Actinomadura litoris TaxID=2678616 RepID=A0A7K1LD85_9ACTN|nr:MULTISPECIES: SGNH/GDSL hydrolase family protein [Actinomadura]MBT2208345.1 SGNH/GDSL hydrolase family protein [Actinomadura sp. NEAU-AAG7]MUN42389.1 SGNH/GDSL hydrolase family protein [Actinomadura litoris]